MGKEATYKELMLFIAELKRKLIEGKKRQQKLEYLLRRHKSLLEQTQNGVAILRVEEKGRDFRFIDINRSAEIIDQIKRQDVRNRLLLDVFPNMDEFGLLNRLRQTYRTGRPGYLQSGFYKDERISGWREYYFYRLSDHETAMVYRDTTHLMNAEAALRQSHTKYMELYHLLKLMADNVPDAIWAKDLEDRFLFVNQAMCDKVLHCRDLQEALGKTDAYFAQRQRDWGYRNTFGEMNIDSDNEIKQSQTSGKFLEDGLVRGVYLALDVHKAPFFGKEGRMIGTVGSARDITKEKKMEKALHDSEKRFSTFMGHFPGVVFLCNESLELIYVNPYMRKVLGKQAEVGRSLNDLFYQENSSKKHTLDCLRALTQGVQESNESVTDGDGNVRVYRMMKFPIYRSGENTILGGIGVDITSLIEAEEALSLAHQSMSNGD